MFLACFDEILSCSKVAFSILRYSCALLYCCFGQMQFNMKLRRINNKKVTKRRRSRPEVFCKKGVLRYFAKFTGKQLRQGLFNGTGLFL